MKKIILLYVLLLTTFCVDSRKKDNETPQKQMTIDSMSKKVTPIVADTIREIYTSKSCSEYLIDEVKEVYNIGTSKKKVIEIKNGLLYIHNHGIINLLDGKLYNVNNSSDRIKLYEILSDSIVCFRLGEEQRIFNLLTDYQYYRKSWSSNIFAETGKIECYNDKIIPIFENDSTLLIVDIQLNRILKRISNGGVFYPESLNHNKKLYIGNKTNVYEIDLTNGNIVTSIQVLGGLGSNIIPFENLIIYWDRSRGLVAIKLESGELAWEFKSTDPNSFVKLMSDNERIYFNDSKVKSLNIRTGELLWTDKSGSYAINEDNIALIGNYLITGMYFDSDGVIILIDTMGKVVCNGYNMPNEMGFYKYSFLNFNIQGSFFAKDGSGYEDKIVQFKFKSN